jgi:hypothetical protein
VVQVRVVLGHTFFMLGSAPKSLAVPVMSNLLFAPNLRKLAKRAIAQAEINTGSKTFNGLHLRIEDDAASFIKRVCFLFLLRLCLLYSMHNTTGLAL